MIVLMTKTYYRVEMSRLLADRNTYQLLSKNPICEFKTDLQRLIDRGVKKNILNIKDAQDLSLSAYRTPVIYFLQKIHKSVTNPPGRHSECFTVTSP